MSENVAAWIDRYRVAWESNRPEDIRALFTDGAEYRTTPHSEPWRGAAEIVDRWLEIKDEPGATAFEWQTLVETEDLVIVRGNTAYAGGPTYSNLWVIRFAGDRASEFTEWWMTQ